MEEASIGSASQRSSFHAGIPVASKRSNNNNHPQRMTSTNTHFIDFQYFFRESTLIQDRDTNQGYTSGTNALLRKVRYLFLELLAATVFLDYHCFWRWVSPSPTLKGKSTADQRTQCGSTYITKIVSKRCFPFIF